MAADGGLLDRFQRLAAELADEVLLDHVADRLDEGIAIGVLDRLHAGLLQRVESRTLGILVHLTLDTGQFNRGLDQNLAHVGREGIELVLVHDDRAGGEGMPRQRQVLLDLEEFGVQDQRDRVLLAVDRAGLQRGEELGEGHRRRHSAKLAEGQDVGRVRRGADLEPTHVGGGVHGAAAVGQVAPADLPRGDRLEVRALELRAQAVADRTVHDGGGMLAALEQEGQVEHVQLGRQAGEERVAGQADVERTAAHRADRLRVGAERAVREDLDLEAAIGALLDLLAELERRLVPAVDLRVRMREAQARRLGQGRAADHEQADACAGAGQSGSAGNGHGCIPPF